MTHHDFVIFRGRTDGPARCLVCGGGVFADEHRPGRVARLSVIYPDLTLSQLEALDDKAFRLLDEEER